MAKKKVEPVPEIIFMLKTDARPDSIMLEGKFYHTENSDPDVIAELILNGSARKAEAGELPERKNERAKKLLSHIPDPADEQRHGKRGTDAGDDDDEPVTAE